ncbi:MAG: M23 family metallopeptidase [Alphaproteobacteria bacterium]|nr:M23 family metallopeptidase [Alphaproteobacteria bacterium]
MTGVLRSNFARFFPERQIYHRRRGHVDFIHISPLTQIIAAVITFCVLTWIAYASVNVVFKNQIIRAKDRRIVTLEATYENRIAELQAGYDEILGILDRSQEQYAESTGELNFRQRQIESLLDYFMTTSADIQGMRHEFEVMGPHVDHESNRNAVLMRLQPKEYVTRVSRTPQLTLSRSADSVSQAIGAVLNTGRRVHMRATPSAEEAVRLEYEEARRRIEQDGMSQVIEERLAEQVDHFEAVITETGLDSVELLSRFSLDGETPAPGAPLTGQGGPLIGGLADMGLWEADAEADDDFRRQLLRIASRIHDLDRLHMAISTMPLIQPVDTYNLTSGMGMRTDPFTRRKAFHPGLDLAARRGTPVMAAAPGTVIWAEWRGAYGRLVEIDHGFGFRTRYGHLDKIDVKKGDIVDLRDRIGQVGSTGRSTGPHLHYEVWFDDELQNPLKFLRAGHYVFEK